MYSPTFEQKNNYYVPSIESKDGVTLSLDTLSQSLS